MIDKYTFGSDQYIRLADHEALMFDMNIRIAMLGQENPRATEERSIMNFVDYVRTINCDDRKHWLDRMAFQYLNRFKEGQ